MSQSTFGSWISRLRHEIRYGASDAWVRYRTRADEKARRKKLLAWFDALHANPPEVLIGANIGRTNGIRHHLEGIRDHSTLRVALAPPDSLLDVVSYHDLHTTFRHEVMECEPRGIAVLHSHVYPYFIKWCRRHRDSGVLWVHTYHLPYFPIHGQPLEPWQVEINSSLIDDARHAHVRLSVSQWQRDYLKNVHGIDSVYIPNGVDLAACDRADPHRFRSPHGRDQFILYVGRNDPVKNPGDFVRLASRMPDHRFVMAGGGLSPQTIERTLGLRAPENVAFTGQLRRDEVQDAIAACSALVVTSVHEGLPTLVLEALVQEKPIVVPDEPGCVEAIRNGEFGFIYPHGNLDDLIAQTRRALKTERSRGARAYVESEYAWQVVAPQLDAIYREAPALAK